MLTDWQKDVKPGDRVWVWAFASAYYTGGWVTELVVELADDRYVYGHRPGKDFVSQADRGYLCPNPAEAWEKCAARAREEEERYRQWAKRYGENAERCRRGEPVPPDTYETLVEGKK